MKNRTIVSTVVSYYKDIDLLESNSKLINNAMSEEKGIVQYCVEAVRIHHR